jgi:hypothetical protein
MSLQYELIDRQTGRVVGTYATLRLALRVADRRDTAYGEPCTTVQQAEG